MAFLGSVIDEIIDEIGCERDNESALMAIHEMKAQLAEKDKRIAAQEDGPC